MATASQEVQNSETLFSQRPLTVDDIFETDGDQTVLDESDSTEECATSHSTLTRSSSKSNSMMQSTPRVGPPPTQPSSQLPSAIKSQQTKEPSYKKIISVLSSIAEISLTSSFRHSKQLDFPKEKTEDRRKKNNGNISNNNFEKSLDATSKCPNETSNDEREPSQCTCSDCKDAVKKDKYRSDSCDRISETSHSMVSLLSSNKGKSESFLCDDSLLENSREPTLDSPEVERSERKSTTDTGSNKFQTWNKILSSTLAAGRKSISHHFVSPKNKKKDESDTESSPFNPFGNRWKSSRRSMQSHKDLEVPELLGAFHKSASVSRRPSTLSTMSYRGGFRENDHSTNTSVDSIMVVLLPPGSSNTNVDIRLTNLAYNRNEVQVRDPLLKELLEELQREMINQEVILKQASKALDHCGKLMHKEIQGILFAEKVLHIASESYFAAEYELTRLIEGGDFEPQRDQVVIRQVSFDLCKTFSDKISSSGKKYVFIVIFKCGHKVEASQILELAPGQRSLTARRDAGDLNGVPQDSDLVFTFNRPNWSFTVEIFSVFMSKPRGSVLNLSKRISRKKDGRNIKSRSGSEEGLRRSSFGRLAHAIFTREDIIDGRQVSLHNSAHSSPLDSTIRLEGDAYLNEPVFFESYLGVKDFHGRFGWLGRMKTFTAKLNNTRLELYEVSESSFDTAVPAHTMDLSKLTEKDIQRDEFTNTYFHDFTLKLGESQNEWLNLCTNSRDDTLLWIEKIKKAIAPARKIILC